ncbi:serine/threonine-protein kinase-like protein CCR1 [Malania oleifera]|uniref:serine/threonine-protein kinase-like protein CCR1 n=1 Tax=Malania oleifera TaxID=397392 RepID=UPI0025AEC43F|nr:serine/threonine-protein kinase-like protein CCR1 [Malania oleifera]
MAPRSCENGETYLYQGSPSSSSVSLTSSPSSRFQFQHRTRRPLSVSSSVHASSDSNQTNPQSTNMEIHDTLSGFLQSPLLLPLLVLLLSVGASGFGSMGPISAAFGELGFFCAIDASGKQDVICWGKNGSSSPFTSSTFSNIPPMASLSGGEGFVCGILANNSQPYCWDSLGSGNDLVPSIFRTNAYSHIAAGKDHVCAIRGSYYSDNDSGTVDCWDIFPTSNRSSISVQRSFLYDQYISTLVFKKVVAGEGFSCGGIREGGVVCWGPNSASLGVAGESENFAILASGRSSLCGISGVSSEVKCWGNANSFVGPPAGIRFVSLTAGGQHFCGIREDNHGIECWGSFNSSSVPRGSGFMAIASSDVTTCGIREDDLVLDCWFADVSLMPDYDPPLQLCSPGLCISGACGEGKFAFNAVILNEPDLTSLCVRKDLKICLPCASNCLKGFFPSSPCSENANRVCTACSLCQNSSCWGVCGHHSAPEMQQKHKQQSLRLVLIISSSISFFLLILISWCFLPRAIAIKKEEGAKKQFASCICKPELETDSNTDSHPLSTASSFGSAQVFRLSELKDATNGFKEFNELGRGSYGFVYKAVLADGRQVAVKRANAATIIHTNSRNFEMELEILCKVRHCNIVNLLGYCLEMGERLLVYEYMPHGTLHDHLYGGLAPLHWSLRLKISMQAAKGLEYLHNEAVPPIVHRDVKTSNILLDSDWGARIADFGLHTPNDTDLTADMKGDVYNFGIVLLEILSGRKAYDRDFTPPSIVEWAVPLIKQGKAAAIIDRYVALPRNFEPLLKLADMAELAVRENSSERPNMSVVAAWLEQIVKDGLIL